MGLGIKRWDVVLVNFDPTIGKEIRKTRPALVVSPDEINGHWSPVVVVPMTTKTRDLNFRAEIEFQGKKGQAAIDQIRAIDKNRIHKVIGRIDESDQINVQVGLNLFFSI